MKTVPTSWHNYNATVTAADMILETSRQTNMIIALPLPSHPSTCLYHNQYLFSSCISFFMSYKFVCLMPCGQGFNSPQGFSNHQRSCTTKLAEKQKDDTYVREMAEKEQKNCSMHLFYLVFIFYWHQMSLVPLEADTTTAAASVQKCPPWAWEKLKLWGSRPCNPLGATNSETLSLFYGLE